VLILRDVLRWKAVEVAELLDTTVASVNSALQRARSMLAARKPSPTDLRPPDDVTHREVLGSYVDAFERYDLEALCSLVREDARRAPGAPRKEAGKPSYAVPGPSTSAPPLTQS
jgi:RNA polymerase sigma-70 factor (ECF subfamily)